MSPKGRRLVASLLLPVIANAVRADDPDEQVLARDGRTDYRVVIADSAEPQVKAVAQDFVQIFQNCVVFNDAVFANFTEKSVRDERTVLIEHDKPLIFGRERDKGLRLRGRDLEVVRFPPGQPPDDLLVHHEEQEDATVAHILSRMKPPGFPVPLGVFRDVSHPTYGDLVKHQIQEARTRGKPDLQDILVGPESWEVT